MQRTIGNVILEVTEGDITKQHDIDAVVNAANAELRTGGGVAGAIHRAAGPGLAEECKSLAPIRPGDAVITSGHGLPNSHVIHCLGPVFGVDTPSDELLASCYQQALDLAERNQLGSVAFPALSTGAFGYPLPEAAQIALATVIQAAEGLRSVRRVRFVLFGREAMEAHRQELERLLPET
ncbi:macro domain-containing protein [Haloechinothrix sp. LS1_15]|nr:macro domain-containing protein [Haloechinothrix sp. LS1_15]